MKFKKDKEISTLVVIFILMLVLLFGIFIGRISAQNTYYIG